MCNFNLPLFWIRTMYRSPFNKQFCAMIDSSWGARINNIACVEHEGVASLRLIILNSTEGCKAFALRTYGFEYNYMEKTRVCGREAWKLVQIILAKNKNRSSNFVGIEWYTECPYLVPVPKNGGETLSVFFFFRIWLKRTRHMRYGLHLPTWRIDWQINLNQCEISDR